MSYLDDLFINDVKHSGSPAGGGSGGSSSGGASSWDDLKDKPFGEVQVEYNKTFEVPTTETFTRTVFTIEKFRYKLGEYITWSYDDLNGQFKISKPVSLSTIFRHASVHLYVALTETDEADVYTLTLEVANMIGHDINLGIQYEYVDVKTLDEKFLPDGAGGGVKSFNDLEDRPFYSNGVNTVTILGEVELEGANGEFVYPYAVEGIVKDEEYTIKYNGIDYICKPQSADFLGEGSLLLGNGTPFGLEENDEPFLILIPPAELIGELGGGLIVMDMEGAESVTLSIRQEVEDIKKLDNKYLDLYWLPTIKIADVLVLDAEIGFTSNMQAIEKYFNIKVGTEYTVLWNGDEYKATAFDGSFTDDAGDIIQYKYIGAPINPKGGLNIDYTDYPFSYYWGRNDTYSSEESYIFKSTTTKENVELQIIEHTFEPNEMPKQFMPKGVNAVYYLSYSELIGNTTLYLYKDKSCTQKARAFEVMENALGTIVIAMYDGVILQSAVYPTSFTYDGSYVRLAVPKIGNGEELQLYTAEYIVE